MLVRLAQATLASEAPSESSLTIPATIAGVVLTLVGVGLLFVNRRRTAENKPDTALGDHTWMYYTGGVASAVGLVLMAYGLLGLGS